MAPRKVLANSSSRPRAGCRAISVSNGGDAVVSTYLRSDAIWSRPIPSSCDATIAQPASGKLGRSARRHSFNGTEAMVAVKRWSSRPIRRFGSRSSMEPRSGVAESGRASYRPAGDPILQSSRDAVIAESDGDVQDAGTHPVLQRRRDAFSTQCFELVAERTSVWRSGCRAR